MIPIHNREASKLSLQLAVNYASELEREWRQSILKPGFRYFFGVHGYYNLKPKLEDDTWGFIQMVSVDNGQVLGYLNASIQRAGNFVSELTVINFQGRPSMAFAHDCAEFFKYLLRLGFHSIRWSVAVGNPAERIYDRLITRCGGRIAGIEREYFAMPDGPRLDCKRYEILVREARI